MTGPTRCSVPTGPWSAGTAVIVSEPSDTSSHGSSPMAGRRAARRRAASCTYGDVGKQRPAGLVEVVSVLVVRQQHGVERPEVGRRHRRPLGLGQHPTAAHVVVARVVERRVDEQAAAADVDDRRRAAHRTDGTPSSRSRTSVVRSRRCRSRSARPQRVTGPRTRPTGSCAACPSSRRPGTPRTCRRAGSSARRSATSAAFSARHG